MALNMDYKGVVKMAPNMNHNVSNLFSPSSVKDTAGARDFSDCVSADVAVNNS